MNLMLNSIDYSTVPSNIKEESNKNFDNIVVERRYKHKISLPNGLENCNISNFDPHLNFNDNNQINNSEVISEFQEDRLVPEGQLRQRCESYSSVSSTMEDRRLVYNNIGVKTFNTVCMDSGSTCISYDHTYPAQTIFKGLDAEETYQNLDTFFKLVPKNIADSIPSVLPVGSPNNDSNSEYSIPSNFSSCSQNSLSETSVSIKCPASDLSINDKLLTLTTGSKRIRESPSGSYYDNQKKNISSKNYRKTRKEKQNEVDFQIAELEKERDYLNTEIQKLENHIQIYKRYLITILRSLK